MGSRMNFLTHHLFISSVSLQRNRPSSTWAFMSTASGPCRPSTWWVRVLSPHFLHPNMFICPLSNIIKNESLHFSRHIWRSPGLPQLFLLAAEGKKDRCRCLSVGQLGLSQLLFHQTKKKMLPFIEGELYFLPLFICFYLERFGFYFWELKLDES